MTGGIALLIPRLHAAAPSGQKLFPNGQRGHLRRLTTKHGELSALARKFSIAYRAAKRPAQNELEPAFLQDDKRIVISLEKLHPSPLLPRGT